MMDTLRPCRMLRGCNSEETPYIETMWQGRARVAPGAARQRSETIPHLGASQSSAARAASSSEGRPMAQRTCNTCGVSKHLQDFAEAPSPSGAYRRRTCRQCRAEYLRRWYRKEMQDPQGRERLRERWRDSASTPDPTANKARYDLNHAVRDGRITPAESCEDCGHDFSRWMRHAHHHDYTEPLHVAWLCSRCHGVRHRQYPSRPGSGP
jgi:hypothetical protein